MNRGKIKVLFALTLSILMIFGMTASAFAEIVDYVAKDDSGNVYVYNGDELVDSYIEGGKLWSSFLDGKVSVAVRDDTGKYVDADAIVNAYIEGIDPNDYVADANAEQYAMPEEYVEVKVGEDGELVETPITEPPVKELTVVSVGAIEDINVDFGTAVEAITFPTKVTLNLSDETTVEVDATFACDNYDGNVAGEYVFTATYELPEGVTGDKPAATVKVVVAAKPLLAVLSVSAINLKQVKVTFNKEVDKASAETATNYAGLSVDPTAKVVLQADKKSVIVNLATALTPYVDTTVTISNVQDVAGKKLESKGFTFKPEDTTVPTVVSAVAKGNKTIELTFSEPVQNSDFIGNYKIDNAVITGGTATANADLTKVTLALPATLTVGEHKVVVFATTGATTNVIDFAGYAVPTKELIVTVAEDTSAPAVSSVAANSQTKVTAVFDKAVNVSLTGDKDKFFWNTSGSATDSAKITDSIKKVNDTTFELTFTTYPLSVGTVSFFVKDIEDFNGNKIAGNVAANTSKTELTVAADVAPAVTKIEAITEDKIVLTFDNAITKASAEARTNYTVKNANGETISLSGAVAPAWDNDKKTVTLTLASKVPGGNYTVTAKNLKSVTNVTLADYTGTVTVTDKTPPTVSGVTATTAKVVVNFNEEMAISGTYSILDLANYRAKLGAAAEGALPNGTTLKALNNNKAVEITLPVGKVFATGDTIKLGYIDGATIKAVADKANNVITPGTVVTVPSIIASGVNLNVGTTLTITTPTTVELALPADAPALATVEANDFKLFKAPASFATTTGVLTIESATLDTTGKKLTFKVAEANKFTADEFAYLYVETNPNLINTKDQLGLKIVEGVAKTVSVNKLPVGLATVVIKDGTNLTVTFDAKVKTGTTGDLTDLANSLVVVHGDKTYTGSSITVAPVTGAPADTGITLTVPAADFLGKTDPVIVKTVPADQITAKANNGALIAANTTGIQSSSFVAGTIAIRDGGLTAVKATGKITVNSNAIDVATAGSLTGGADMATDIAKATDLQLKLKINGESVERKIDTSSVAGANPTVDEMVTALNTAFTGSDVTFSKAGNKIVATSTKLGAGSSIAVEASCDPSKDIQAKLKFDTASNPVVADGADKDTITVAGNKYVFVPTSGVLKDTTARVAVEVGANVNATATNLLNKLVTTDTTNVDGSSAVVENVITVVAKSDIASTGNAVVLAKSTDPNNHFTLSGATLSGGVDAVSAVANTVNAGDKITITFNRNVNPSSIVAGWDGTSAKAISNLVTFSGATKTITFAGANIGSIKSSFMTGDGIADAKVQLTDSRTLLITLTKVTGTISLTGADIVYTPDANISSTSNTAIDVKVKPAASNAAF